MRFYKDKENKVLEKVICNCCGKELSHSGDIVTEGVLHICKDWGFFSRKDLLCHEFDLCEQCYDRITAGFVLPVTEREIMEV